MIHLMPRFIRILSNTATTTNDNFSITNTATTTNNSISIDNSKEHNIESNKLIVCIDDSSDNNTVIGELLPVHVIMRHWLKEALTPVINMMELSSIQRMTTIEWSNHIANLRGTLACFPGKVSWLLIEFKSVVVKICTSYTDCFYVANL